MTRAVRNGSLWLAFAGEVTEITDALPWAARIDRSDGV